MSLMLRIGVLSSESLGTEMMMLWDFSAGVEPTSADTERKLLNPFADLEDNDDE